MIGTVEWQETPLKFLWYLISFSQILQSGDREEVSADERLETFNCEPIEIELLIVQFEPEK